MKDEPFYLTIPYRLWQGDALFKSEWHMSQLSSFLIYPLFSLYMRIWGSTEGIILAFRYIFTFIWGVATIIIFLRLSRISFRAACFSSLTFFLYTRAGIMALSYNTLGVMNLTLSLVISATSERYNKADALISGMLFASSVLCCPYLAVLYIFNTFLSLIRFLKSNYNLTKWKYQTIGIVTIAIFFCVFVLNRCNLYEIVQALPYIVMDSEHPGFYLFEKLESYYFDSLFFIPAFKYYVVFILIAALLGLSWKKSRKYSFILASLFFAYIEFTIVINPDCTLDYVMFPINILGLLSFIINPKRNRKLFFEIYLPGILYTLCLTFSSNTGFSAISCASSVSAVGSFILIDDYVNTIEHSISRNTFAHKIITISFCIIFVFQLASEAHFRFSVAYCEGPISQQKEFLNCGAEARLLVTELKYDYNTCLLEDTSSLRTDPELTSLLFITYDPWLYLETDKENAAPSAWFSGF